ALGEYAERAAAVEEAATADEIHDAVQGLPEEAAGTVHRGRWIVALLGGTEQRRRWRLSRRLQVIAAFGGATLDLSAAQAEAFRVRHHCGSGPRRRRDHRPAGRVGSALWVLAARR